VGAVGVRGARGGEDAGFVGEEVRDEGLDGGHQDGLDGVAFGLGEGFEGFHFDGGGVRLWFGDGWVSSNEDVI
jgi:hypothetical protein